MADTSPPVTIHPRYQTTHYTRSSIIAFLTLFIALGVFFYFLLTGFQHHLMQNELVLAPEVHSKLRLADEPLIQPSKGHSTNDWQDYAALQRSQTSTLAGYELLADQPGYARIPVERAMILSLKRNGSTSPATGGPRP